MMECTGLEQRVFIGDILDADEEMHEIKVTFDDATWEDGGHEYSESQNEEFEMDGEYVTYDDLVLRFGKSKINTFIENAADDAR